jgi:hypothetical protein
MSFYLYICIILFPCFPVYSILYGFAGLLLSFRASMFLRIFTDVHIQFSCKIRYKKWGIISAFGHCPRVAPVVSPRCFGRRINGRKIPSNFAAYFKQQFIAMLKSEDIYMPAVGKTGRKINTANMKVCGANAQSRTGGILLSSDNGKLYFGALKILSVPQNNLPLQGGKRSEVAFPSKTITTKFRII